MNMQNILSVNFPRCDCLSINIYEHDATHLGSGSVGLMNLGCPGTIVGGETDWSGARTSVSSSHCAGMLTRLLTWPRSQGA